MPSKKKFVKTEVLAYTLLLLCAALLIFPRFIRIFLPDIQARIVEVSFLELCLPAALMILGIFFIVLIPRIIIRAKQGLVDKPYVVAFSTTAFAIGLPTTAITIFLDGGMQLINDLSKKLNSQKLTIISREKYHYGPSMPDTLKIKFQEIPDEYDFVLPDYSIKTGPAKVILLPQSKYIVDIKQ